LRSLFKTKGKKQLSLDEYQVKEATSIYRFVPETYIESSLHFKGRVYTQVKRILEKTDYYPLKAICKELNELLKKNGYN
jgi:hypothetical protein